MERGKVGAWSYYRQRNVCKEKVIITCIYPTERGGRSYEVVIISYGAIGLNDYVEYATEKATIEELKLQHSYFIDGLYKTADLTKSS